MLIDADCAGTGPAAVLLHAGVADRRMWSHQAALLQEDGFTVVTPDLRGYGSTPAAELPWSPAADVVAVVDSLGLDRFSLVGASAGASVAVQVAARVPERVDALVLLCPALPDLDPSEELRAIWRAEAGLLEAGDVDGAVSLAVEHFLGPEADPAARGLVASMQRRAYELQLTADAEEEDEGGVDLGRLTVPTLAIAGGRDVRDFTGAARRVAREVPGAELVELAWAGHLPSLERPDETARLVLRFLRRHLRPGPPSSDPVP